MGSGLAECFFISMKARVGARTEDTDAIKSFSMQVLG
jgi:hypothetical protein